MKATSKKASQVYPAANTADYAEKIEKALQLQSEIKTAAKELEGIKEYFHDEFESNKSVEVISTNKGSALVKRTNSYSVLPEAVPGLKKLFKEGYTGFVTEKISYGVSAAFKSLLSDGDYKHSDKIREAVVIKTAPSVVFEALKEVKKKSA